MALDLLPRTQQLRSGRQQLLLVEYAFSPMKFHALFFFF